MPQGQGAALSNELGSRGCHASRLLCTFSSSGWGAAIAPQCFAGLYMGLLVGDMLNIRLRVVHRGL